MSNFTFLPQCFKKLSAAVVSKRLSVCMWERVKSFLYAFSESKHEIDRTNCVFEIEIIFIYEQQRRYFNSFPLADAF